MTGPKLASQDEIVAKAALLGSDIPELVKENPQL